MALTVANPGGESGTLANAFTYVAPSATAPVVSSVAPNAGPDTGGTSVVISGSNFAAGARVFFGASPAAGVNVTSATQISAVTPPNPPGTVSVRVENPNADSDLRTNAFTYQATTAEQPVSPAPPELPRAQVDVSLPDMSSFLAVPVINTGDPVLNGVNLQTALDVAICGTVIRIERGGVYRRAGGFVVPAKLCAPGQWLIIRSSAADSELPSPGTRISHAYDAQMPLLEWSSVNVPGIQISPGAMRVRLIGLRVRPVAGSWDDSSAEIIRIGRSGNAQATEAQQPNHIIIDRSILEGISNPPMGIHGVALHGANLAIIDSMIERAHRVGFEAQAIRGWNGNGPLLIRNNYIEGSGMCMLLGGAGGPIVGAIPQDVTFQRNHCFKPLTWKLGDPSYAGTRWGVKNHIELKLGKRVLIEGNIFENVWADAQTGSPFVIGTSTNRGSTPWADVSDVTVRFNKTITAEGAGGISASTGSSPNPGGFARRVHVHDNLFLDIRGGTGRTFGIFGMTAEVLIQHNTVILSAQPAAAVAFESFVSTPLLPMGPVALHDNIFHRGTNGISQNCKVDGVNVPCYTSASWFRNLVYGTSPASSWCSTTNRGTIWAVHAAACPVDSLDAVGFVGLASSNFRLLDSSPGRNRATDGDDVGLTRNGYDRMECLTSAARAGTPAVCP